MPLAFRHITSIDCIPIFSNWNSSHIYIYINFESDHKCVIPNTNIISILVGTVFSNTYICENQTSYAYISRIFGTLENTLNITAGHIAHAPSFGYVAFNANSLCIYMYCAGRVYIPPDKDDMGKGKSRFTMTPQWIIFQMYYTIYAFGYMVVCLYMWWRLLMVKSRRDSRNVMQSNCSSIEVEQLLATIK